MGRASRRAPWRIDRLEEARAKLGEAETQLAAGRTGSAVFFASRAQRSADTLLGEARRIEGDPTVRFVAGRRVNLRAGPSTDDGVIRVLTRATPVFPEREQGDWVLVRTLSGGAGWIYGPLLEP